MRIIAMVASVVVCMSLWAAAETPTHTAGLVSPLTPEAAPVAEALADALTDAGYTVVALDMKDLCEPDFAAARGIDLLALPDAAALPAAATGPVEGYLRAGGDILAFNAPLWQRQLIEDDGAWVTAEQFQERHAADLLESVLFDFAPGSLDGWSRSTNDSGTVTTHTIETGLPAPIHHALHVEISRLNNWDTYVSPEIERPFPEGHTLTVFHARGVSRTTALAIEWTERDGSRWIATVPLTSEWRQYVLEPEDFRFWQSVPARAQDVFRPENAYRMSVGLALTHTHIPGDEHEYYFGPFGTARRNPRHEKLLTTFAIPAFDTLSPGYKFFEPTEVFAVAARPVQDFLPQLPFACPEAMRCVHPRPQAGGFAKGRDWRWAALLEARTVDGRWRGNPAALTVHADGPFKGGVWASFGVADVAWYQTPAMLVGLRHLLAAMRDGVFLVDGGTSFYTYFDDQPVTVGARLVNLGKSPRPGLRVRVRLEAPSDGGTVAEREWTVALEPGTETVVSAELDTPAAWPEDVLTATVELADTTRDDDVIDAARHDTAVWRPRESPEFMTTQGGEFLLDGKRWRAHGVNYMPSSGIGTEDWHYFEHWIGARAYDPEIIQRDLEQVRSMHMNSVSIFIYRESMEAQNLLDILRRIEALGMKANLSLRPGTPFDFEWPWIREMIEYYRLKDNDTVFAYDLAWEPMFPHHEERVRWDAHWRDWLLERYGGIENAERDWGYPAPRNDQGAVTNPPSQYTVDDGEWRVMVAAYRRFLDTLLYEYYGRARRLVRGIDPNHLVSFRMTEAGNPTFRWGGTVPYDYAYLAGAVDILEPEAYGRIGEWEKVKPGWFTYEYGRWANPELPMLWAEAGVHVWDVGRMQISEERLEFQAQYYRDLYRLFIGSGADGIFFWWYPGGYRVNERSDYGIIEPDGSDRPVTRVIREHAYAFMDGPSAKPVDHWLEIDRDPHPAGIAGIYDDVGAEFWEAIAEGKTPGLRTAGAGTTSADCPLPAVGNRPYNGDNPPKFLDGFFDVVEVRNAAGAWEEVARGGSVRVDPGAAVIARVAVTNLNEATWLAPAGHEGAGAVYVTAGALRTALPATLPRFATAVFEVALHPAGLREATEVVLSFEAAERARFGPRFPVNLVPNN